MIEQAARARLILGQVVHGNRDDPVRTLDQLFGPRALPTMSLHVAHVTVEALLQPGFKPRLAFGEVDVADAEALEAERGCPFCDVFAQRSRIQS